MTRRLVGWRIAVLATGPHGGWQRVAAVTHVLRIAVTPIGKQRGCLFPMREDAVREARGWTNHQTRLIRVYRMRRLVGYRVTWRHTGDPRQMLYTLAESEHARSYARAAADNLRRVQAITDVRVWRVYRRRCA